MSTSKKTASGKKASVAVPTIPAKFPSAMVQAPLVAELRQLIDAARHTAAVVVNTSLTLLYWRVGQRIHTEVLGQTRAAYGQEILPTVSAELRHWRHFGMWRLACGAIDF